MGPPFRRRLCLISDHPESFLALCIRPVVCRIFMQFGMLSHGCQKRASGNSFTRDAEGRTHALTSSTRGPAYCSRPSYSKPSIDSCERTPHWFRILRLAPHCSFRTPTIAGPSPLQSDPLSHDDDEGMASTTHAPATVDVTPKGDLVRLDSVEDALAAFKRGEFLVVVDDMDRENEGDLIIAAEHVTQQQMAWLIRHSS